MTFSAQKLDNILKYIEFCIKFKSDDLTSFLSYNIYGGIDKEEY